MSDGDLHPHDTRKCSAPGCPNNGREELKMVLTEGRIVRYCSPECAKDHELLMKRHLPEMGG